MRTKVLLCAAALAVGTALSTMAQNVYSLNVVGYINLPLVEGWNLVANQLDADGQGTNNTIQSVFGNSMPLDTAVSVWDPKTAQFLGATYALPKGGTQGTWQGAPTAPFNPGQGAWVNIKAGSFGGTTQNVTTVGTVLQGTLANTQIPAAGGFALLGNIVPVAGALQTQLNYQPKADDAISQWNPAAQTFVGATYAALKGGGFAWQPAEPNIKVGEGFWLSTAPGSTWSTNFTVPQQ